MLGQSCCWPFLPIIGSCYQRRGVAGEGLGDGWCLVHIQRGKPPFFPCSAMFFVLVFFLSQGAEGEMVFPTEETPFKSDNTTELFNSGQPLPLLALGALVTDLGRVIAGWWGGFRVQPRVHLCLVSRPKSPKPLPCAGFSGHAGQPSCSCSPATTQLGGSVAEASPPHYLSHRAMLPAQNPFPLSLPWGWSWLQLVPGAWLLLPGGCRLRWWCWHGFRQMAAG